MKQLIGAFALQVLCTACGSNDTPTAPTTPSPPSSPAMTIQVDPNPLQSTFKSSSGSTATFELRASVTFRESNGVSGTITQVVGSAVRLPGGQTSGGSLSVNLQLPAGGAVNDTYTQPFDVDASVDSIVWRLTASGIDAQGRAFSAVSTDIVVNPPIVTAPPPLAGPVRLELWGGVNNDVFLGCFSCNQFVSESVFNQFGRYGSRFSSTSIWNQFSPYGSQFATTSACNQFASSPPRLINTAAGTYTELTLNLFRAFANHSAAIVDLLRNNVCVG